MAAYNYYHQNGEHPAVPPSYDQVTPPPDPFNRLPPSQHGYVGASASPWDSTTPDHDPHYARYSQNSLTSDNGAYPIGGRRNYGDQDAENIPLQQAHSRSDWMQQPTHYAPSPDAQYHPDPSLGPGSRRRKKGFFRKKIPWVTYVLTAVQVAVFIAELVKSGQLTGSPIEIKPNFNPMIGPSPYIQINMGARFTPCMKNVAGLQNSTQPVDWNCPNSTTNDPKDPDNHCSLSELCGFNGVPNPHPGGSLDDRPQPNQWFRFIIPMFLHGGFIHIGFNLLVQLTMGTDMERMIGWWRYGLVYVASGIFGFVLGGNYAAQGLPSTGCSGALFGILALFILDLLYTWNERPSALVELIIMILGVGVSFVLGLLPSLDNFSHIGGFVMGLALGLSIMRSPNALRERIGMARTPYVAMSGGAGPSADGENKATALGSSVVDFFKGRRGLSSSTEEKSGPLGFFKGRKPLWWAWWLVRAGALVAVFIGFIFLIVDFYKYYNSNCSWCYRLSCLPVKDWCEQGQLDFEKRN